MRLKLAVVTLVLLSLPFSPANADRFWRHVLTLGATSGSTFLSLRDHKVAMATQEDASSFVASDGKIRGPYLEAAIQKVRAENPGLHASDMDVANAILAKNAVTSD